MFVIERALVGQTKAPSVTVCQADTEAGFEGRKPAADRGRRRAHRRGGGGNAAGLDNRAEKLDVADTVRHGCLPMFPLAGNIASCGTAFRRLCGGPSSCSDK